MNITRLLRLSTVAIYSSKMWIMWSWASRSQTIGWLVACGGVSVLVQLVHLNLFTYRFSFPFSFRNTARLIVGFSCRNAAKCCFLSSKIVNTSQGHNKTPTITCGNVLTVTFLSKPNRLDCLSFMYAIIVPMKIQTNTIFAITISINKSKLGIAIFYIPLRITGWQWSAADLPVRVDAADRAPAYHFLKPRHTQPTDHPKP